MSSDETSTDDRAHRKTPSTLAIALAAALVVALVACVWLAVQRSDQADELKDARDQAQTLQAEKDADQEAVTAANAFVAKATTYSYKAGQHDFAWVDQLQNEKVRTSLKERVADLAKAVVTSKTSAKGQVVQSAGRVVGADQVEVLAYYNQGITDDSGAVSVQEGSILLTMKLVGGAWKVDSLTFLSQVSP